MLGSLAASVATLDCLVAHRLHSQCRRFGKHPTDIDQVTAALPLDQGRLTAWATRQKTDSLARLGVGGPGLSSAAFNAGVANLTNVMNTNARDRLDYERAKSEMSFSEKHGPAMAQKLYNLCDVGRDIDLPEIHRLLAKAPKNRESGILISAFQERTEASPVPLMIANGPIPTTKLQNEVFRNMAPAQTGAVFASGLSPFSMVCEGHSEAQAVTTKVQQAAMAEGGTSLTLADAEKLTASDVRFPTTPQIAAEKLCAFSIAVDIFHGVGTDIANSVRACVLELGPLLHVVHQNFGGADSERSGMDVVLGLLFEVQQDYNGWANLKQHGKACTVPDLRPTLGKRPILAHHRH